MNYTTLISSMKTIVLSKNQTIVARQQHLSIIYFTCIPKQHIEAKNKIAYREYFTQSIPVQDNRKCSKKNCCEI